MCAFEVIPWLNNWLQLVTMPDTAFRTTILSILAVSVVGTVAWDQLMLLIFAPDILFTAYRDTIRALPTPADMVKQSKKPLFGALMADLYFFNPATAGNGILLVGGFYAMRHPFFRN